MYNQHVFYRNSSGKNQKPSSGDAEKIRLGNMRLLTALVESADAVKLVNNRKELQGSIMKAIQLAVNGSVSNKWESENLAADCTVLIRAKQLLDSYFGDVRNRRVVVTRAKKNTRAENASASSKTGKHKLAANNKWSENSLVGSLVPKKRVASVAPSHSRKQGNKKKRSA